MNRFHAAISLILLASMVIVTRVQARQEGAPGDFQIRVPVDLVNINFSATDSKGRMLPGLTADDFSVEEDGVEQHISLFAREHELPLTLAMLIDISPSVRPIFEDEKRTAAAFLDSILGDRDLALVISFAQWVTLVQDYTESLPGLTMAIENLELAKSGTSLYDAVYLAAEEKLAHEAGRKAIVLMSDGDDQTSMYNESKALIAAHNSNAVIYAISNGSRTGSLRKLAEETGGALFRIRRGEDFDAIFEQIALELRNQYSVAYQSSNAARDGKFRRIKIVPRDSNVKIRARRGYYAANESAASR